MGRGARHKELKQHFTVSGTLDKMKMKQGVMRLIVFVSLICCCSGQPPTKIPKLDDVTCRDENGVAVDWFIMYKEPYVKDKFTGLEYFYIDSEGKPPTNHKDISHQAGVLANTLDPMFKPTTQMSDDFAFISYSDQPPGAQANSDWFGHSKGVVLMDRTSPTSTGVWLVHSTPQFPFRREANNFWPQSGKKNAQTFLCVTFKYDQFPTIGLHLHSIRAYPFDYDVPFGFHQDLPDMMQMINWRQNPPPNTVPVYKPLQSNGNQQFVSVAKRQSRTGNREDGDLYLSIAKQVKSDVLVQSWPNGGDKSHCPKHGYKVININTVEIKNWQTWSRAHDHSKWCITADPDKPLTCFADMNISESQYMRSGGALCFKEDKKDNQVWRMFYGLIHDTDECSNVAAGERRGGGPSPDDKKDGKA